MCFLGLEYENTNYNTNETKTGSNNVTEEVLKFIQSSYPQPALFLNKLYPNAVYTCSEIENNFQYKTKITIGDKQFSGIGEIKKIAKKASAIEAISSLKTVLNNESRQDLPEICRK